MKSCRPAALVLVVAIACGSDAGFVSVLDDIPEPPENGVQLHFGQITLAPGEDLEFCTYFNLEDRDTIEARGDKFLLHDLIANGVDLDADRLAVSKVDIAASQGLHHVQLLAIENDTFDEPDKHIFDCAIDLFGGPLTGDVEPVFFTSLPRFSVEYDPGIARILRRVSDVRDATATRGTQFIYNFHYLNATDHEIKSEVVVNLHMVDPDTVVHPIRSAWWNYIYFNALAGEPAQIDASGGFLVDVNLVGMTSHLHEMGTEFSYDRGGEEIYRTLSWNEPDYLTFPSETTLPAGEMLDFHCEWFNSSSDNRYFGLQADDEMCTAIVEYYAVDEAEAEALLEMQRVIREQEGENASPFGGTQVTLETFSPMPPELIAQASEDPLNALDILDREIMCGVAANLKEMEDQYGRSPQVLEGIQLMVDLMADLCDLN